jgi:hypothetical protein
VLIAFFLRKKAKQGSSEAVKSRESNLMHAWRIWTPSDRKKEKFDSQPASKQAIPKETTSRRKTGSATTQDNHPRQKAPITVRQLQLLEKCPNF